MYRNRSCIKTNYVFIIIIVVFFFWSSLRDVSIINKYITFGESQAQPTHQLCWHPSYILVYRLTDVCCLLKTPKWQYRWRLCNFNLHLFFLRSIVSQNNNNNTIIVSLKNNRQWSWKRSNNTVTCLDTGGEEKTHWGPPNNVCRFFFDIWLTIEHTWIMQW